MTTEFRKALAAFGNIDGALTHWEQNKPQIANDAKAIEAGSDALTIAHYKAMDAAWQAPATTLQDIAAKIGFLAERPEFADMCNDWALTAVQQIAAEMKAISDRPYQDTFAVLLRAYDDAVAKRDLEAKTDKPNTTNGRNAATDAYEARLEPFHDAVHEAAQAVLRAEAPDAAAIAEKQRVFNEQAMSGAGDDDNHAFFNQLAADAIALAK